MEKINPVIQWWVTPKLPYHDIFELPLLISKTKTAKYRHIFSSWIIHPIKRRLVKLYLRYLQKTSDIKVIAITGSAGKTTTKEMLFSILKNHGKTVCTLTYLDPVYNIPNTILATPIGTRYLILEMGVEYPGEMDFYLWLAKPDIGVITNIFPTHTEFLGDIEGVLKEKSKLVKSLSKSGFAVLNENDIQLKSLINKVDPKVIWFNGENSDAARKVAEILGVSAKNIEKGLKSYQRPRHRYEIIEHKSGAVIFDDSYNSNPEALLVTLKKFNELAEKHNKIAVLGDMKELGKIEESEHRRVGKEIAKSNFDVVIGVGGLVRFLLDEVSIGSPNTKTYQFEKAEDVLPALEPKLEKGVYLLVKGSRSIGLDWLVEKLL